MAKVEMDLSEFKEIEKNKELLEKSLKENKKYQKEIDELKEKELQLLRDNSKVVTIINKTEKTEHLLKRRDPYEIIERLQRDSRQRINHYNYRSQSDLINELDWISQSFWDVTTSYSMDEKSVTTKGLDEYLIELEEKVRNDIDKEIQEKLNRLNSLEENILILENNLKEVKSDLRKAESDLELITKENIEQEELIEYLDNKIEQFSDVKEILNQSYNIFNYSKIINEAKTIVNE